MSVALWLHYQTPDGEVAPTPVPMVKPTSGMALVLYSLQTATPPTAHGIAARSGLSHDRVKRWLTLANYADFVTVLARRGPGHEAVYALTTTGLRVARGES